MSTEQRAQIALRLFAARRKQALPEVEALPEIHPDPQNRYDQFPLSDIQQAYLIGRSSNVELGNISCQTYFEVDVADWDHERFEAALQAMIERHEMLRCVVLPDGNQQILKDVPRYRVQSADLRGQEPRAAAARLTAVRAEMCAESRPTDQWPLFDFRVSHLDSGHSRLHVSFDLLIMDARSFELFFSELAQLYHNPRAILPPLEVSFRDYLLAFNSIEKTEPYRKSREYWLKRLSTLPSAPELPLATNTPVIARPDFKRRHARIAAAAWQSLKEKSARLSLTPAGILVAAYAEVMAIWSKNPRLTINLTLFNRLPLHKQINQIIGDFTSVTLLEVDNSGSTAFEACAKRLQEQLWQDLDHRYFSGVRVMRELRRSQGVGPSATMPVVFTSFLNLGNGNEGTLGAGRLGQIVYGLSQTPQLYLDCIVHEEGQELVINWDSVDEVFPPGLVDDMFQSYRSLLSDLACDNSSWNRGLDEMARRLIPSTQIRLREEVNSTEAPVSDELLHTLFLKQVEERPEQTAVCTPQCRLTYAEVYRRACAIEELLVGRGIRPNQLVAVMMEKGWEQVVAVLGILFAGGAYLPISPELPAERQRQLIERGEVKVVLTHSAVQSSLSVPAGVEVLAVDLVKSSDSSQVGPRRRQKPEDLAYVIFTSGSTGQPKGVMIDHRGAVNTVLDINRRFGIGCQDRVLALSRLSFDLSVYDIFGLLAAGGTIVMPSPELALDVAHWAHLIASEKVTVWNTVPTLMQVLVEEAEQAGVIGQSLRLILMSGDWIPTSLPGRIRSLFPQAKMVSLGGATEASIWSIFYPIDQTDPSWTSIPYGKPMLNQNFYVLTDTLAPRPVWVPGALYIGGIGLAKGYWRDEEKTNAAFIHDPTTGHRLYRTGDVGRYLPDGNIEFLGREDFQIKLRGYRIELGEIEGVLAGHSGVKESVAAVREDKSGERRLYAYVVQRADHWVTVGDLREFLKQRLPAYMVPSEFVMLEALPLSSSGKVDRRSLPLPLPCQSKTGDACVKPRSPVEAQILRIWEELLEVRPIGVQDDFFELGGNSLLAVRLMYRIDRACGKRLPLATLFASATIEHLARALLEIEPEAPRSPIVKVQSGGSDHPFFFCHGDYGGGSYCRNLAPLLGKQQPFYVISPHGLDGESVPCTIEAMAADRLRTLLEHRPSGPYLLGGYCNGGLVAFEMARQMRQRGLTVDLLVVVDASAMNVRFRGWRRLTEFLGTLLRRRGEVRLEWFLCLRAFFLVLSGLSQEGLRGQILFVLNKIKKIGERVLGRVSRQPRINPSTDSDPHIDKNFLTCLRAMDGYVPGPYQGQMVFLRTDAMRSVSGSDPTAGWGSVAEQVEVRWLPGDHNACVGKHVGILAEHLAYLLRAANRSTPAPTETTPK